MKLIVIPLISAPGIQRDGTPYLSKTCIDGQWVRWYQGVPRKIGGYVLKGSGITNSTLYPNANYPDLNPNLEEGFEITNTIYSVVQSDDTVDVYFGKPSTLSYIDYDQNSNAIGVEQDRTPLLSSEPASDPPGSDGGFVPNPNNSWTIDLVTINQTTGDSQGNATYIVAHPALNRINIANQIPSTVFYGQTYSTARLQPIKWVAYESNPADPPNPPLIPIADINDAPVQVSGGVVFINPITVFYGNNGVVYFTDPQVRIIPNGSEPDITVTPPSEVWYGNSASLTNTKIVKCIPYRGANTNAAGGNSPSMLVWSINTLLKANYVPSYTDSSGLEIEATFTSQIIQSGISILSAKSIVEYNNIVYWVGDNHFYYYNGIVNKIENTMNTDYFFNGLNAAYKGLIFSYANPRYDEIWIYYPRDGATFCNAALVYNVKGEFWYDAFSSRSAAHIPITFERPILASSELENLFNIGVNKNAYPIWLHEKGLNKVKGASQYAIQSYFQTHLIDLFSNDPENNNFLKTRRLELDLIQSGPMTVSVYNYLRPRSSPIIGGPYLFFSSDVSVEDITSQGSLVSFRFESNTAVGDTDAPIPGGYYQFGKTLLNYTVGDERK